MNYTHGSTAKEYTYPNQDNYYDPYEEAAREKNLHRSRLAQRSRNRATTLRHILLALGLCLAASFMVLKFVAVEETNKRIKDLNKELAAQQTYTSEKTFALEQLVSLSAIEDAAMTRLGMQRPDKTQIVYVDIKKNDKTDIVCSEVEGTKNRVESKMKNLFKLSKGIFSAPLPQKVATVSAALPADFPQ